MLKGMDFVDFISYIEKKEINPPKKEKPELFFNEYRLHLNLF
jgi:hypothetical protein